MKLAIVILNWNGRDMLNRYLPTLLANTAHEYKVYVADNASTDGSLTLLKDSFPNVRTILLDQNYGFAEGYNRALKQIEAEYYLLLNSDVEVAPGWLNPMLWFLETNTEVAACQPKILSVHDRKRFEYAGACGGFIDKYGYPYCRGRIFDTVEFDNGQYDSPMEIQWTTGACMLIRSSDYWSAGGLDGRFFAHNEEIDLCWRLRLMGRKLYCIPQSKVFHVGGGTLAKSNPRKTFLNFRNNLTMLYKNLPEQELNHVMRVRWGLDYLSAFVMLILNRSYGDFMAIIKARKAFRKWKYQFKSDREKNIQEYQSQNSYAVRSPFSILWQYYVRHNKEFYRLPSSKNKTNRTYPNVMLLPQIEVLLNEGHTITLQLRGYSMRPFLEDNRDKALLIKADHIAVGDAVLAKIPQGGYVLHRIVKIKGNEITLLGDGNLTPEHCMRSDIIGFAVGFYRKGSTSIDKTNGLKWGTYSIIWMLLRPLRRYLLAFYRRIWLKIFKPI